MNFIFVENVVSETEVTDFQSLIFDYKKKWSPLENACKFQEKIHLLLLDMLVPNINVKSFILLMFFFAEQLVTMQLPNIYEYFFVCSWFSGIGLHPSKRYSQPLRGPVIFAGKRGYRHQKWKQK